MGSCASRDEDGSPGASASFFGSASRPSSYSDLRIKLKHAEIDSTKPYNFWVQLLNKEGKSIVPGEPKKVKIPCGAEGVIVMHDLPSKGGYFVQLMTGDRNEYKVRQEVYVNNAATRSEKGDVAELHYAPIIPNEWHKHSSMTLLTLWISLSEEEKKARSLWFRACNANGTKVVESKQVKAVVNKGSSPKVQLRAWVPTNAVEHIEIYARSFFLGNAFSGPKPLYRLDMPEPNTTTHMDGFDLEGEPRNFTQRKVPLSGLEGPTSKITIDSLHFPH